MAESTTGKTTGRIVDPGIRRLKPSSHRNRSLFVLHIRHVKRRNRNPKDRFAVLIVKGVTLQAEGDE